MDDTISRQNAIDALLENVRTIDGYCATDDPIIDKDDAIKAINDLPPAPQWIPVKYRPMDDEERKDFEETFGPLADDEAVMFDCKMPQDGQEVWVCSKCGNVWQDTCQIDEGICLEDNGDWLDIVAWMPYIRPEPWKGEE